MFAVSEGILLKEINFEYSKMILEHALRKNIQNFINHKDLYLSKFSSKELLSLNSKVITEIDYIDNRLLDEMNYQSSYKVIQIIKQYNKITFNLLKFLMIKFKHFNKSPLAFLINKKEIELNNDEILELLAEYSKYQHKCILGMIDSEEYLKHFIENNPIFFENNQKEILLAVCSKISQIDIIEKYFKNEFIEMAIDTIIERIEKIGISNGNIKWKTFTLLNVNMSILKLATPEKWDCL